MLLHTVHEQVSIYLLHLCYQSIFIICHYVPSHCFLNFQKMMSPECESWPTKYNFRPRSHTWKSPQSRLDHKPHQHLISIINLVPQPKLVPEPSLGETIALLNAYLLKANFPNDHILKFSDLLSMPKFFLENQFKTFHLFQLTISLNKYFGAFTIDKVQFWC